MSSERNHVQIDFVYLWNLRISYHKVFFSAYKMTLITELTSYATLVQIGCI